MHDFTLDHNNLHSAAFQLAAQIVMKGIDYPLHCLYNKSEKLYYRARGGES